MVCTGPLPNGIPVCDINIARYKMNECGKKVRGIVNIPHFVHTNVTISMDEWILDFVPTNKPKKI